MSDQFVAEIRVFPFNFAPVGWALCDGQILPISQNTALFSLLGTTYGGNGTSTFALPDLQGFSPLHVGAAQPGPGLSLRSLGEEGGEPTVTLVESEMPAHSHSPHANTTGGQDSPVNNVWASGIKGRPAAYAASTSPLAPMAPTLALAGNGLPHNNLMLYLTLNFCIALQGIFPTRS